MKVSIRGESTEYRKLRDQLLEAEIALKDQTERVAALRRRLPPGPLVEIDYVFREGPFDLRDDSPAHFCDVRLSELFAPGKDSLIVDHLMWAPQDQLPCRMCNMWADGYAAVAPHVNDKVNFVLVAKVEIGRLRDWGRRRGWDKIRLLSSHDNTFNHDFFVEDEGGQRPAVSVFRRAPDGKMYFTYTTEMSRNPGHHRGIDPFSPVWHLYDLLPEGRENWMPKHFYGPDTKASVMPAPALGQSAKPGA
ncbi:MAG TPA: DUF899 family protein [Candidatus Acidoferrales bacterium]|nr:DUF899 family protein [Candidatus Acidoferrales bacterium]